MSTRKIIIHVQALARLLTQSKAQFATLKEFNQYKKQHIHAFRNHLLAEQLHSPVSALSFAQHEQGKPFLTSHPLHFNHSHSQQNYTLALSERVSDIGVDVEDLSRKVRFEALAERTFHAEEYQIWQHSQDTEYWFKVWTTKEAVLKAAGVGIALDLNSLNTQVHPIHNGGMCSHPQLGSFAYQNFILNNSIMLTVAWRAEPSCRGFQLPSIQIIQH